MEETLELLVNAFTICSKIPFLKNDEDMLLSISRTTLTTLHSTQRVCNMRYAYQSALIDRGAATIALKLFEIFSDSIK